MKKVVFFTDENKIGEAFNNFNLKGFTHKKIPFKLHMGKKDYYELLKIHGFSKKNIGCDVVIDDKGIPVKIEGRDYEVAENLYKSSHIFAFSHVKGQNANGFGGTIKNFGMGGVTKETKLKMHHGSRPMFQKDKCTY